VFGCLAYVFIPKEQRGDKLDDRAYSGIFVGYSPSTKQYHVYNPSTQAVKLATSVQFKESIRGGDVFYPDSKANIAILPTSLDEHEFDLEEDIDLGIDTEEPLRTQEVTDYVTENREDRAESVDSEASIGSNIIVRPHQAPGAPPDLGPRRSIRDRRPPIRFDARRVDYSTSKEILTPATYDEAVSSKQCREWTQAIDDERTSLLTNDTFEIVDRKDGVNLVTTKWVFKVKQLPNGQIDKYKACLVARGFTQCYGIDYFETFSPVVRLEALRLLVAVAALKHYKIHQMDVPSAYLQSPLKEDVYLEPPEGIEVPDGKVLHLKKGLYGLKQSGRLWNQTITQFFEKHGLLAIPADHSVFTNKDGTLTVALYVDDLLIFAPSEREMVDLKQGLTDQFKIKDLGEARYLLGVQLLQEANGTITIDQQHYIEEMLYEFKLDQIGNTQRSISTPASGYTSLLPREDTDKPTDVREYQTLIGKLNWIVRATRIDTAFVTQKLSQFTQNPMARHLGGAIHLLRYLDLTKSYHISYSPTGNRLPIGYADADYAADPTRKSTMGYCFLLAGGPISWSSKLQRSTSTSTTEAEYIALGNAAKEAVWIHRFLEQIYFPSASPVQVLGDNQAAIALVKNPEFHARTKHLDVALHYVRELVEDELVNIHYCPTKDMLADCLTKPLPRTRLLRNVEGLGYISPSKKKQTLKHKDLITQQIDKFLPSENDKN
jgi:hypothetical protein